MSFQGIADVESRWRSFMRLIPVAAALLRNLLAHHRPTLVGSRAHRIPPRACNIGGGWRFQPLVNDSSSRGLHERSRSHDRGRRALCLRDRRTPAWQQRHPSPSRCRLPQGSQKTKPSRRRWLVVTLGEVSTPRSPSAARRSSDTALSRARPVGK